VPRCSLARLSPVQCCSSPAWLGCNCRSLPVVDHKLCAIVCHIPVFASRVQRSNRSSRQGPTFTSTSTSTSACCGGGGLLWCCSLAKGQSSDWRAWWCPTAPQETETETAASHSLSGRRSPQTRLLQPQCSAAQHSTAAGAAQSAVLGSVAFAAQRSTASCVQLLVLPPSRRSLIPALALAQPRAGALKTAPRPGVH
jgi:hypothetical protein